jgi:hypothetical protein
MHPNPHRIEYGHDRARLINVAAVGCRMIQDLLNNHICKSRFYGRLEHISASMHERRQETTFRWYAQVVLHVFLTHACLWSLLAKHIDTSYCTEYMNTCIVDPSGHLQHIAKGRFFITKRHKT